MIVNTSNWEKSIILFTSILLILYKLSLALVGSLMPNRD